MSTLSRLDMMISVYNPAAEYTLNDDRTAIVAWRGPGAQPTMQQMQDAWNAHETQLAQQAQAAQQADSSDRIALDEIQRRWNTYLDTPLASITGAMTVTVVKDLIRVMRFVLRRLLNEYHTNW